MERFMKRVLLIFSLLFLLAIAVPAAAQSSLAVDVLQVQLLPEYDQPSMLVIYTIQLSIDQTLPAEVSVRIPARVGDPMAVTVREADSVLRYREYTRTVEGEWSEITFLADFPLIQIEYYDTALSQKDQPRSYDFRWLSDFDINNLVVSVIEPVNTTGMNILPNLGNVSESVDGLTIYNSNLGSWSAGETFDLTLSYTKNNTKLSVGGSSSSFFDALPPWAWALIGVGMLVLLGGGVIFVRNQSDNGRSTYRQKKQRKGSRRTTRSASRGKSKAFCHQCGSPAVAGDKFCRECGSKLRL